MGEGEDEDLGKMWLDDMEQELETTEIRNW